MTWVEGIKDQDAHIFWTKSASPQELRLLQNEKWINVLQNSYGILYSSGLDPPVLKFEQILVIQLINLLINSKKDCKVYITRLKPKKAHYLEP